MANKMICRECDVEFEDVGTVNLCDECLGFCITVGAAEPVYVAYVAPDTDPA